MYFKGQLSKYMHSALAILWRLPLALTLNQLHFCADGLCGHGQDFPLPPPHRFLSASELVPFIPPFLPPHNLLRSVGKCEDGFVRSLAQGKGVVNGIRG